MNMHFKMTVALAMLTVFPILRAFGTEPAGTPETLIVTATRNPAPADTLLAPVAVIARDTLSRSLSPDITDLLRFEAGVDVARTGGPGQPVSVFIRGAESNHTLVLIDGVRMNPGTVGSAALQNVPPNLIERIEIVKGPRSTLYGSDAIGGVINLITRRAEPGLRLEAEAGAGDYDTRHGNLHASWAGEHSEFGADFAYIDSDGFPTRTLDSTDRGFENVAMNVHGRAELGPLDVRLRHWQAQGRSEYSDFFLTPVDQDFRNAVTAITFEHAVADLWRSRLTASRMQDRIVQNDSDDHLETERYALDWQNDFRFAAGHLLTAGLLVQREDATSESFGLGFDTRTDVTNIYLQDQLDLGRHRVLLAAGLTDHETFGQEFTWNAEYGYGLTARTRLTLAGGTAFRAPDAADRFGFAGNPDLDPERSLGFEIGMRHELGERHVLTLSAFENRIDDLIEFVVTDPVTFDGELRNVDSARIRGLEAGYEYLGEAWRLRAQMSLQRPENRSTGEDLLRRARESFTIGATRAFGPVEVGLDLLYAGPRKDIGFPDPVDMSSYVLANLAVRAQLTRMLSLIANVENLLDEDYELASSYNTPDRSVFFALRYAYQ
jgi:vitamin B12 transporter